MDRLRLGVIGTGSVVREIYQYLYFKSRYSGLIDVVAACDVLEESLDWFGETFDIPRQSRYRDYRAMLEAGGLDAVAVNTPDSFHREPVVAALSAGIDVIVPKPTASTVSDAHAMIEAARVHGRYLGVDYHKRGDPVVLEATARHRSGQYGTLQIGVFSMLDRLMVADPNYHPRFFSSPDFAEQNSPVSFLTSHMTDSFITITGLYPVSVESVGYKQKLATLEPIRSGGWDTVDTTIVFDNGAQVHVMTGWILPNPATCITVQSGRLLYSDGVLDLWNETYGYHEVTAGGIQDRNVQFLNFGPDGVVGGYGISTPGRILEEIIAHREGKQVAEAARTPVTSGVLTTLVCESAHASLSLGEEIAPGVVKGARVDCRDLLESQIGADAASAYVDRH